MPRYLFSLLLVLAVAVFGVLGDTAMAGEMQATAAPCHTEPTPHSGRADAVGHCGAAVHAMSGACAIACLGSLAPWLPSADPLPPAYHPVAHPAPVPLVLCGRTGETADRPPKSV